MLQTGEIRYLRTRRDNRVSKRHPSSSVFLRNEDPVGGFEKSGSLDDFHVVFFAKVRDSFFKPGNRIVFPCRHLFQIQRNRPDIDSHGVGFSAFPVLVRCFDQGLGRNTTGVKTHAPQTVAINEHHLFSQLPKPDRGHVAAWSAADHHTIGFLEAFTHHHTKFLRSNPTARYSDRTNDASVPTEIPRQPRRRRSDGQNQSLTEAFFEPRLFHREQPRDRKSAPRPK